MPIPCPSARLTRLALLAAILALLLPEGPSAAPKPPVVSVLYFENATPGQGARGEAAGPDFLGKALVELALSDLSLVKGVVLVERAQLDKALKELELGLSGLSDEANAPRIGEIVGARYLVVGSYVETPSSVELAFRIVGAEDGVILKAGRASGSVQDMGALVGTLSSSIARALQEAFKGVDASALLSAPASEGRLSLSELRDFGRALDLEDSGRAAEAAELLRLLMSGERSGSRFAAALAALQRRLASYDERRASALAAAAALPRDYGEFLKTAAAYVSSARLGLLREYCLRVRESPPAAPAGAAVGVPEMNDYYLVYAYQGLKRLPETIKEGEDFLRRYPGSMYYQSVRGFVRQASEGLASAQARRERAEAALASIRAGASSWPSRRLAYAEAGAWSAEGFWKEALALYLSLDLADPGIEGIPGDMVAYQAFVAAYQVPDKASGQELLTVLEKAYPRSSYLPAARSMMDYFPQ